MAEGCGCVFEVLKAEMIARKAHKGVVGKDGKPYVEHPKTVASFVKTKDEKVVAWLHDVVEDTDITLEDIRNMFGDKIACALDCVTHREGEDYMDYVARAKMNEIARNVKLADLKHNMDLTRLEEITEMDIKRLEKYEKAKRFLTE